MRAPIRYDTSGIMDPRKLLSRRYQMMIFHLGLIIALIIVSSFEVRSAILLSIHSTSALLFLLYVPGSALLTWRASKRGEKHERREAGWTWDCAGLEVTYLAVQCGTTLASSVLCALTLSSSECFGGGSWALDEFAMVKERDVNDWCQGVIGATVLSWVQFGLDLGWLGWIVSVVRAGSGVRSDDEGLELTRRQSRVIGSPTSTDNRGVTLASADTLHPRPHTHHLFQTMLTPTPVLLSALAERRWAADQARKAAIEEEYRQRMRRGQFAPTLEERQRRQEELGLGLGQGGGGGGAVSRPGLRMSEHSGETDRTLASDDLELGIVGIQAPIAGGDGEVLPPYRETGKVPAYPGLGTRG